MESTTHKDKSRGENHLKDNYIPADDIYGGGMYEVGNIFSEGSEESDGEYLSFEDDDDEEKRIDCLSRLHDCCSLLGDAPFHPD